VGPWQLAVGSVFVGGKVDGETTNVRVYEAETGHVIGTGWCAILRGRVGAIYLGLISLGRGKTGPGEGLECSIRGIFWLWRDGGGCEGCTEDGGCAGMDGGRRECAGTMWGVLGVLVVGREGEMGLGCGGLGVGRMVLVVGGRLGNSARGVGGASVDRLRVVVVRRGELVHGRVIRRILGVLAIVCVHPRLVMGRRRTAKDGLVRLVALVWLTWASWALHRGWRWGGLLVVVGRIGLAASVECSVVQATVRMGNARQRTVWFWNPTLSQRTPQRQASISLLL
jgi:hypothetical protein